MPGGTRDKKHRQKRKIHFYLFTSCCDLFTSCEPFVKSYPGDQVRPSRCGASWTVPRIVLCLVQRGQLAVGAKREAVFVENPWAFVAASQVAGLAAGAAATYTKRESGGEQKRDSVSVRRQGPWGRKRVVEWEPGRKRSTANGRIRLVSPGAGKRSAVTSTHGDSPCIIRSSQRAPGKPSIRQAK